MPAVPANTPRCVERWRCCFARLSAIYDRMHIAFSNIKLVGLSLAVAFSGLSLSLSAATYKLGSPKDGLIGAITSAEAREDDTLLDIARLNGLGYHEIKLANPMVDTWLPARDRPIVLPTVFVIPAAPREGIVLNIPEMRLYYFPQKNSGVVITHPLGIGRQGWATPYTDTKIIQKKTNPYWYPPPSIRKEHAEQGAPLPERVEPGPDNPLGHYAMRLGLPEYLIHGTNKPFGIGMRVSHGCIRLYPEDIESLFRQVKLGTPVHIINQPFKVGRRGNNIYLEAHPYLDEDAEQFASSLTSVVSMLVKMTGDADYVVDWELARAIIERKDGIPMAIGTFLEGAEVGKPVATDEVSMEDPKTEPGYPEAKKETASLLN